jgi:hypothetical protein
MIMCTISKGRWSRALFCEEGGEGLLLIARIRGGFSQSTSVLLTGRGISWYGVLVGAVSYTRLVLCLRTVRKKHAEISPVRFCGVKPDTTLFRVQVS